MTSFSDLGLTEPLLRALAAEGYEAPTPIQARAIPSLLAGRDLKGIAQTGTGKTAAFALPILQRLAARKGRMPRSPRALILTPTRELAVQIADSFKVYGRFVPLKHTVIFGGVGQGPQVTALAHGVDVAVATPGRLLDLMSQGHVRFDRLEVFVLDEADRMLDMGFINDVRRIVARLPAERQTLLFSATMPAAVRELAAGLLKNPETAEVAPPATTVELIDQKVMFVEKADKRALLAGLLGDPAIERALVFTRTKHGASRLAEQLERAGHAADAIHGNKSQSARQRALEAFRAGRLRVLVATDIAARGIDVDGITHVVNFDLPNEPESYVHRIGRTARAGARGVAISFCDRDERAFLADIEKTIRRRVPVEASHAFHQGATAQPAAQPRQPQRTAQPAGRAPAPGRSGGWGRRRRAA